MLYRQRVYQSYVSTNDRLVHSARINVEDYPYLNKVIRDHFPQDRDAKIIDLGCGRGNLVYCATQQGYAGVRGVDASPEQVQEGARLGLKDISEGDVLETLRALPEKSYDVVLTFDLIEHFTKDEFIVLIDEVRRVLKDGGKWILHTPNAGSPFFGTIRYGDITHEQAFTANSLNQLLRASHFRQVNCYEDVPIPHGLKSWLRSLLWKIVRFGYQACLMVETGSGGGPSAIFSQNLLAVATK